MKLKDLIALILPSIPVLLFMLLLSPISCLLLGSEGPLTDGVIEQVPISGEISLLESEEIKLEYNGILSVNPFNWDIDFFMEGQKIPIGKCTYSEQNDLSIEIFSQKLNMADAGIEISRSQLVQGWEHERSFTNQKMNYDYRQVHGDLDMLVRIEMTNYFTISGFKLIIKIPDSLITMSGTIND